MTGDVGRADHSDVIESRKHVIRNAKEKRPTAPILRCQKDFWPGRSTSDRKPSDTRQTALHPVVCSPPSSPADGFRGRGTVGDDDRYRCAPSSIPVEGRPIAFVLHELCPVKNRHVHTHVCTRTRKVHATPDVCWGERKNKNKRVVSGRHDDGCPGLPFDQVGRRVRVGFLRPRAPFAFDPVSGTCHSNARSVFLRQPIVERQISPVKRQRPFDTACLFYGERLLIFVSIK